jgi:cytochrome c biogenesis factor
MPKRTPMDIPQQTADAMIAGIGSKATQAGATTYVVSWALSSEMGVLIGIVVALIGLGVNFWFRRKQDKREQAAHDARIKHEDEAHALRMILRGDHLGKE